MRKCMAEKTFLPFCLHLYILLKIAPEGVTEILHQKAHGPFIGEIEDGQSVTGLISNLFVAPLFKHEPESTDFLMILGRNSGASVAGRAESLSVILRDMPTSSGLPSSDNSESLFNKVKL